MLKPIAKAGKQLPCDVVALPCDFATVNYGMNGVDRLIRHEIRDSVLVIEANGMLRHEFSMCGMEESLYLDQSSCYPWHKEFYVPIQIIPKCPLGTPMSKRAGIS